MIDPFNRTLQLLLPVRMVLASSDNVNSRLISKYNCTLGNVFQLFPQLTDLSGVIRDPSTSTTHQLNCINLSIHHLSCLVRDKSVKSSNNDTNNRETNLLSVVSKTVIKDVMNLDESINEIPVTPWFTEWKNCFLQTFSSCGHEYMNAFIGVIYVILIDEISSYKDIIFSLNEQISSIDIRWFSASFLRYFILLNLDPNASASQFACNEHFREFTSQYGSANCFWYDIVDDNDIVVALDDNVTPVNAESSDSSMRESVNVNAISHGNGNGTVDNLSLNLSQCTVVDPLTSPVSMEPVNLQLINPPAHVTCYSSVINPPNNQVNSSGNIYSSSLIKPVVSQGILLLTERCLKNMIESCLVPWTDRLMRILHDAISARKGIRKSLKVFLGMAPGSSVIRGPTSYIYKLEADEMQARKFGDLAFALGLYELAFKYYHTARDEFKADSACIYYAGAAEMTGITAFLTKRHNFKHYFDQSLTTYLDVCHNRQLAVRTVIVASECIRTLSPTDAANYFIRLTSEDSDLMSALFLEQAAICFLESALPRKRKSSFHFVLAGHRYNKCGLRRHALSCYCRFKSIHWSAACDHVNITIARLLMSLADKNELALTSENNEKVWRKGLDLLQNNTDKQVFLEDFVKEVIKRGLLANRFTLTVPHVVSLRMDPIEGSTNIQGRVTCFKNEPVTFNVTLYSPFSINIQQFTLHTNSESCSASVIQSLDLDGAIEQTITLTLIAHETGPLHLLGFQFLIQPWDIKATVSLDEARARKNQLTVIETLPPVDMHLQIGSYTEDVDAIEMLTGEYMTCKLSLSLSPHYAGNVDWIPSSLKLFTDAQLFDVSSRQMIPVSLGSPMSGIDVKFAPHLNILHLQAPFGHRSHTITFRVEYRDNRYTRSVTRKVEIYCRECIAVECVLEGGIVSLRNTLSAKAIQLITDESDDPLDLYPGTTANVLIDANQLIPWRCSSRQGFLLFDQSPHTTIVAEM